MATYTILSPLRVRVSKNKEFSLNLNIYRNAAYYLLNISKIVYKEQLIDQVSRLPTFTQIQLTYTLYPPTNRKMDISNILSIHDKYFSDVLVELGKIRDDDYKYIPSVIYKFGEVDKSNPRVEIEIEEINGD